MKNFIVALSFIILTACIEDTTPVDVKETNLSTDSLLISAISNQYGNKNTSKLYALSPTDAAGNALTYTVSTSDSNINSSIVDDTLTLTPTSDWSGVSSVTITATDGVLNDSFTFIMTVLDVTLPPVIASNDPAISTPPAIPTF